MPARDIETVAEIAQAYRTGAAMPADIVARSYARIRALNDPAVFISIRDEGDALAEAQALAASGDRNLPLFGIPVAVKDNIDVRGLPTTAACPDFAYRPALDAAAVARLRKAGAIVIGKTNLDQFATGLVGVRSPYGVPRNPFDPKLIPGGSSSGSAVAVATGIVPVALGTDTAGSGRVPALFNNIVGLKPSLGIVSTVGVVPACRTLDCVSVFAHTTDDCWSVLAVMAGFDPDDAYARRRPLQQPHALPPHLRLGVPRPGQCIFFGDRRAANDYAAALERLARLGATIAEIDIEPFYETARLLYEGPWLAERYAATRSFIASSPQSMHPVTRDIILEGARPLAVDAFAAFYRLEHLRRVVQQTFAQVDALALPTAPTLYTVEQILADPIGLNSRLGTYTNFVNLLDLCGLAVPAALHHGGGSDSGASPADFSPPPCGEGSGVGVEPSGITVPYGTTPHPDPPPQGGREFRAGASGAAPFGITLLAPGGNDGLLAAIGRQFHADAGLPIGALGRKQPGLAPLPDVPGDAVPLAVVGAHLSGMPLNHELRIHQARFVVATATAPDYRLYALAGTTPPKPGLLRVAAGEGSAIAVEVWAMPPEPFGRFTAAIPPPLSIGSVRLADGRWVKGFLVEAEAVNGARDISGFGGWREFVAKAG
jgi:allophanate hydrolase